MKNLLATCLCLPLAATVFPYVLEEDMQRKLVLKSTMTMELMETTLLVQVDDEQREMPVPERTQAVTNEERVSFMDTISSIDGEQPGRIEREFLKISREESQVIEQEGRDTQRGTRSGTSPFEGETVNLTRDEEGEWSAAVEDDEDFDQELLDKLTANFGFRDYLPEDLEAEVGDRWDLPLEIFDQFRNPAGRLSIEFDQPSGFPGYGNQFMENLEGEFTAEFSSLDEENQRAVLTLECELRTEMEDGFELTIPEAEGEVERWSEVKLALEGELIWDLEQGRMLSMQMQGDLNSIVRITQYVRPDAGPFGEQISTQTMTLEGTLDHAIEIE